MVFLQENYFMRSAANGSPGGIDSPGEDDKELIRRPYHTKTFKVELCFAAKVPLRSFAAALKGQEYGNAQEALRVLHIILRNHAAKQGCLLVRQTCFQNNPLDFFDLGGGMLGCRGFYSSFRATEGGLSLSIDNSTTVIVRPGPVIDFLIASQNVEDIYQIDWSKAKSMLKNLRIKAAPSNTEYKIVGLSELPCNQQFFTLKQRSVGNGNSGGDAQSTEITVFDYFVKILGVNRKYSADWPSTNVGKPMRPTFIPIELCSMVSLQRYTKALSTLQRSSLVEKSRQKPQERMSVLSEALKHHNYDADPMLRACGVSIATQFTQIHGCVLPAPRLTAGNGEDFFPRNGRWNFNNKKLIEPSTVDRWAVVNFSACCDVQNVIRDLIKCGNMKGINIEQPFDVFDENPSVRHGPPIARVEDMFEQVESNFPGVPRFLLCLPPERKNSDIYGPWKRKCLVDRGIVTQCMAPTRVNDQYLMNVLLKINCKLGGMNSFLQVEHSLVVPLISKIQTIILGVVISHDSPGQSNVPSIAAGNSSSPISKGSDD